MPLITKRISPTNPKHGIQKYISASLEGNNSTMLNASMSNTNLKRIQYLEVKFVTYYKFKVLALLNVLNYNVIILA